MMMSEFGVLDSIIRDSGGTSNIPGDEEIPQGSLPISLEHGDVDVLSASMHQSGILTSNGLNDNNDVSYLIRYT